MPNMSYCRFENTFKDLEDCYDALQEAEDLTSLIIESNQYERQYIKKLIRLCTEISEEFGNELNNIDSDGLSND